MGHGLAQTKFQPYVAMRRQTKSGSYSEDQFSKRRQLKVDDPHRWKHHGRGAKDLQLDSEGTKGSK